MKISFLSLIVILSINTYSYGMKELELEHAADQEISKTAYEMKKSDLDMQTIEHIIASCPNRLKKIITMIENKEKFSPDSFPKFLLLLGESGVGKTMLAESIPNKGNMDYSLVNCPLISNEYKNSGIQNLRRIFKPILKQGQQKVIILDEIRGITEDSDMANEFCYILDDMKKVKNYSLVIATSNSADMLSDRLKDRFSTKMFTIPLPDKNMRKAIAKHYLDKSKSVYNHAIIDTIANRTNNSSGRLIEKVCHESAIEAKLRQIKSNTDNLSISNDDVNEAFMIINKSLKVLNPHQHSDFYSKLKQIGQAISPYALPTFGLSLGIYACYKQSIQNQTLSSSMLHITEEN